MSTVESPFARTATGNDGGNYERPPVGAHPAILVALIDLGTRTQTFQGQSQDRHKILFAWELTAEADSKGQNFIVSGDFTLSLHKKSGYRPFIEGWIGRTLADGESFDPVQLLGQPCQVTLAEGMTGGGKKYIEVTSACKPMRGLTVPPATKPTFIFLFDEQLSSSSDPDIPDWVPMIYGRKVADDIKESHEWSNLSPF
jgi:hypothetical protein